MYRIFSVLNTQGSILTQVWKVIVCDMFMPCANKSFCHGCCCSDCGCGRCCCYCCDVSVILGWHGFGAVYRIMVDQLWRLRAQKIAFVVVVFVVVVMRLCYFRVG